ncbi:hypothetical protein P3342_005016 [Pyrenophora teres f. teres]|uniref:Uncharacterized protein n=1 Tax=Pyrenophora teres f. teres TaxID=97479 RepID=A0A6S6VWU7_9PLEO|nr:hypothetical protein P3342_005016 [Pyrenophora teres f. teres]CAE7022290.1 hypothetical protein PTTW11_03406 [Pyrenophora teres f. teres]
MCDIQDGEEIEITICYTNAVTTKQPQLYLKQHSGSTKVPPNPQSPDVYSNPVRLAISYENKARTTVFAEKAHKLRIICTGKDGDKVQAIKCLMSYPASHEYYGLSKEWRFAKDAVPRGLNEEGSEKWLWRLE